MIEINLATTKKPFKLPVVLGFDLGELKLRPFLLVLLIALLPDFLLTSDWKKDVQVLQQKNTMLITERNKLQKESSGLKNVQEQIERLNLQEKQLKNKLEVVKKLLKMRENPSEILLYIAKNMPKDLWLTFVSLKGNKLTLRGKSASYRSIGYFIESLKSSIFFSGNPQITKSQATINEDTDQRIEDFEIEAFLRRLAQ